MKQGDIMTFLVAIFGLLMIQFSQEGFALSFCPPRTMAVSLHEAGNAAECVCLEGFTGPQCRYRAENGSKILNISWISNQWALVQIQHQGRKERAEISVRPVVYKDNISYGKWRRVNLHSVVKINTADNAAPSTIAFLNLPTDASYEVRMMLLNPDGEIRPAVYMFLDAQKISAEGEAMTFKNVLADVKSFKDDRVLRGLSIGLVGGCIAVLLIQTTCYCIMGSSTKCAKKLRSRRNLNGDVPTDVVIDIEKSNEIEQAYDETETTVPEVKETGTEEVQE